MGEYGEYGELVELSSPSLDWQNDVPIARDYEDVYYSKTDGLAESRYVFLQKNGLPERLKNTSHFAVGETGFGTGINFLALWHAWRNLPEPRPKLHVVSTELHPLRAEDIQRAHTPWPELSELSAQLCAALPLAIKGPHRRWFEGGDITLDLLYGDAATMLNHYKETYIDAWFLDGFAPAQNATMWSDALYNAMANLSHAHTSFATFTAAGEVKRGLRAAGFEAEKTRGFGTKRDMLIGRFSQDQERLGDPLPSAHDKTRRITILGAGIAGCMAAWRYAKQGYHVSLYEKGDTIAPGASANQAAAFTPFYPAEWKPRGRMLASGFWTTHHIIHLLREKGHVIRGDFCGTLMLDKRDGSSRSERLADWQNSLQLPTEIRRIVTADEASDIAGVPLSEGGWFYPHGGWFNMADLCHALLADAGEAVELHMQKTITSLDNFTGEPLLLANAHAATELLPDVKMNLLHGQTIRFDANAPWDGLRCVVHAGHTLIPSAQGTLQWGASFRRDVTEPEIFEEDTQMLVKELADYFPSLMPSNPVAWAGIRSHHADRLPLISAHRCGAQLHLGHGARGMLSSSLAFETAFFQL